jgi:hypothetical protein
MLTAIRFDAEPELYYVGVQLLGWSDAGFDEIEAAFKVKPQGKEVERKDAK